MSLARLPRPPPHKTATILENTASVMLFGGTRSVSSKTECRMDRGFRTEPVSRPQPAASGLAAPTTTHPLRSASPRPGSGVAYFLGQGLQPVAVDRRELADDVGVR
jgi:hypothetical protein